MTPLEWTQLIWSIFVLSFSISMLAYCRKALKETKRNSERAQFFANRAERYAKIATDTANRLTLNMREAARDVLEKEKSDRQV